MSKKIDTSANISLVETKTGKFPARKFFTASHETALLPNLIEVQLNSYRWFVEKGLKELLAEINPIRDFTGKNLELSFGDYFFDKSKPTAFLSVSCAARRVDPIPTNGSRTSSPL